MNDPSRAPRPCSVERLLPWGLAAVLIAPSVLWAVRDRAVWSWDPAFYAMDTVDLWFTLANHPAEWFARMRTVFTAKAPGIAWLGQFFVPLGTWMGSVEIGLLLSVLAIQCTTLALTFRIGRKIASGSLLPSAIGTVFVAASPLFVSASHHYMTEALQLLAITYVVWVAAESESLPPSRILLHLVIATSIGMIVKFATPAYIVFPALLAVVRGVTAMARRRERPTFGRREIALGVLAGALVAFGLSWYTRNGKTVYAFAKLAASSDMALDYGHRAALLDKLAYWIAAMRTDLLTPSTFWLLLVGSFPAGCALVRRLRKQDMAADASLVVATILQIMLVLLAMATTVNEDTRYLLALAPMLAVVFVSMAAVLPRGIIIGFVLVLAGQWGLVNARQLGIVASGTGASYWEKPPELSASRMRAVASAVDRTCTEQTAGRWMMVGVNFDWLNHYTLMFYSTKAQLERGFRCYYDYLGHAPKDADAAYQRVVQRNGPYFISLQESAMPNPPDFLNGVSLDVLRRVERDPRFVRVPFDVSRDAGIALFRDVAHQQGGH